MRYARTIVHDHALQRILHHAAVDHLLRRREDPTEDVASLVEARWQDESYTVDSAVVATRGQTVEELKDALLRLPLIYRTALVLHDWRDSRSSRSPGSRGSDCRPPSSGFGADT